MMTYPVSIATKTRLRAFALWMAVTSPPANAGDQPSLSLGRHLAADCISCHATSTSGGAIPSIAGRPATELSALLQAYASGSLADGRSANPLMVSVARSLDATEIAAVSAYLATLAKP
jgi:cytochrome c553